MDRTTIKSNVANLPPSKLGEIQEDDEIWEETDREAHLKVTRHQLQVDDEHTANIIALTVSGPIEERHRIIEEFTEVYGRPVILDIDPGDGIGIVLWTSN